MNMKTTAFAILTGLIAATGLRAADSFKDEKEKASYAVGLNLGKLEAAGH